MRIWQKGIGTQISGWSARHPISAVVLISVLAVVINCYPVIFCGKSFVSPSCLPWLVYDWGSPLPGISPDEKYVYQHGSDTGAMMGWEIPAGFIESRSLLEHGELPLWNRYGHAGATFIGQAITMLGDPLQLIVILGRGSAVAWDIKFLTAKFIFCTGFGLLILRLLGSRPLSLAYATLAAYCGAFFYIANHPVFFVFCYAPWILLSGLALLDFSSKRYFWWGLVWLAVNVGCFNGGHVESAVVLVGGLNLTAVAYALALCHTGSHWLKILGRMVIVTFLFLGLTAPVWMSFLGALDGAFSIHQEIKVRQLPFIGLPRIFDDFFYPFLLSRFNLPQSPAAGLLVLLGCILSAADWRQSRREPFFWINIGAIGLWGGCVFGWVPAFILATIPLLNRVGHIFVDFSYLLIIHLMIQSAFGFRSLARLGGAFLKGCNQLVLILVLSVVSFMFFSSLSRFGLYNFGDPRWMQTPGPRAVLNEPSPAIDQIKARQSEPFRMAGLGWSFYGDYAAVYELEDIRSCAPLSNGEYINLVREFPGMNLSDDWVIRIKNPTQARPLLNLLNVKYLLVPPLYDLHDAIGYNVVGRSDFMILENPGVWPRAFFSDKITIIPSNKKFIEYLANCGQQPFAALTKEELVGQPGLQKMESTDVPTVVPATNYQLLPNSTAFNVHATSAGIVCLTEGQANGFTATANGEAKPVLTVNRAFKGIYLDHPGDYHIQFTYRPSHWRLACALFWLSAGGVISLMIITFIATRQHCKGGDVS